MKPLTAMTLGELADQYRDEWDAQEVAQKVADNHKRQADVIGIEILARIENEDLEDVRTKRITLSRNEQLLPHVTNWDAVTQWMANGNRWEFMRKQLNTAPFREMIDRGEPLPDGLEMVMVPKLNRRRTNG